MPLFVYGNDVSVGRTEQLSKQFLKNIKIISNFLEQLEHFELSGQIENATATRDD
jgi:hypothetical protein